MKIGQILAESNAVKIEMAARFDLIDHLNVIGRRIQSG